MSNSSKKNNNLIFYLGVGMVILLIAFLKFSHISGTMEVVLILIGLVSLFTIKILTREKKDKKQ